ncbi:unannotated protein [freshwater metagenome]|uniref:Unannotated protein n=1 Tax=freshwater metagenome TaxID=449393 RepID=A0A6J6KHS1_9ZZZZ
MTNSILVIKLRLRDRVVDVDSREQKLALFEEFIEAVNTSRGLLGDTHNLRCNLGEASGGLLQATTQDLENNFPFGGILCGRLGNNAGLFELNALVDEHGGVATIVKNHVGARSSIGAPVEDLLGAPPVLVEGFALPRKHRGSSGALRGSVANNNSCGSLILSRKNVAACPTNLCTESHQRLDEHRGLHGHVKRPRNARTLQGLVGTKFFTEGHEAWHLVLSKAKLVATSLCERQIGNAVLEWSGCQHCSIVTGFCLNASREWHVSWPRTESTPTQRLEPPPCALLSTPQR